MWMIESSGGGWERKLRKNLKISQNLKRDKINYGTVVKRKGKSSLSSPKAVSGWKLNYKIHFSCDYVALKFILKCSRIFQHHFIFISLVKVNFYYCGWIIAGVQCQNCSCSFHTYILLRKCVSHGNFHTNWVISLDTFNCNRFCWCSHSFIFIPLTVWCVRERFNEVLRSYLSRFRLKSMQTFIWPR